MNPDSVDRRDHPRSRGVYLKRDAVQTENDGSSPLARGLPVNWSTSSSAPRIIPARAGFTPYDWWVRVRWRDHPRSRGVYGMRRRSKRSVSGSSPLARGLLEPNENGDIPSGIIPARAGFTTRNKSKSPDDQDHPRSRGVYTASASAQESTSGSSPLARGLQCSGRTLFYR